MRIGYKVLRPDMRGPLYPTIWYRLRKWVVPPIGHGPMCVFTNQREVEWFMRWHAPYRVFYCLYVPSNEDHPYSLHTCGAYTKVPGIALADAVYLTLEKDT